MKSVFSLLRPLGGKKIPGLLQFSGALFLERNASLFFREIRRDYDPRWRLCKTRRKRASLALRNLVFPTAGCVLKHYLINRSPIFVFERDKEAPSNVGTKEKVSNFLTRLINLMFAIFVQLNFCSPE